MILSLPLCRWVVVYVEIGCCCQSNGDEYVINIVSRMSENRLECGVWCVMEINYLNRCVHGPISGFRRELRLSVISVVSINEARSCFLSNKIDSKQNNSQLVKTKK